MSTRSLRLLAAALVLVLGARAAHAAGARFWQVSTQADFLKGDVEGVSIDQHGRLVLGPAVTPAGDSAAPYLWTLLAAPDGGLYAGSGNDGRVYRYTRDGARSVFFDAAELEVHAIAPAPNGGLYVGTSPDGKIYRVDASGASTVYFDPEDKYIWALATDASGVLYAGSGEKGLVYRITAEGKGDVFYRTKATHATALLVERSGDVLIGTESPGKVLRVHKDGSGFVVLDPGLQEISALRLDDKGQLYAAGFTGKASMDDRGPGAPGSGSGAATPRGRAVGFHGDYVDDDCGRVRGERRERGARPRRPPRGEGRRVPHRARRVVRRRLGLERRCALRRAAGAGWVAPRRDRQQGQGVPPVWRPGARHAGRTRRRPAGHRIRARSPRSGLVRDGEPRQAAASLGRAGHPRHVHLGRARRRDRGHVGRPQLARIDPGGHGREAAFAVRQHVGPRRNLERVVVGGRARAANRSRAPRPATCSGGWSSRGLRP